MAKFELSVYDDKGKVSKKLTREFMPVGLYIQFQEMSAKVMGEKFNSDAELFVALKDLFLATFGDLTEDDYMNHTDVAEILVLWKNVLEKATTALPVGNSKNA